MMTRSPLARITAPLFPMNPVQLLIRSAVLLALCAAPAQAQTWKPMGPAPLVDLTTYGKPPFVSTYVSGMTQTIAGQPNVNPSVGAMSALLPVTEKLMYASAVNGGVWKTENGGETWTPIGDKLPSLSIGTMTFDASVTDKQSAKIWVGFGHKSALSFVGGYLGGIAYYDPSQSKWTAPAGNAQLQGMNITQMAARDQDIFVAAKTVMNGTTVQKPGGVWFSNDGGSKFNVLATGLAAGDVTALIEVPVTGGPTTLYAGVVADDKAKSGIYVATKDAGGTAWSVWTKVEGITAGTTDQPSNRIMLSASKGGVVVASMLSRTADKYAVDPPVTVQLYQIKDGVMMADLGVPVVSVKDTAIPLFNGGQSDLHGSLLVDPVNPNIVYVGGDRQPSLNSKLGAVQWNGNLFRGVYNADLKTTSWESITNDFTGNKSAPHADSRFLFLFGGKLYETDDTGIYARTLPESKTGTWEALTGTLQVAEMHTARWNSLHHAVVGSSQDMGASVQLASASPAQTVIGSGDGGVVAVNPGWKSLDGKHGAAAVYASSQELSGLTRYRITAAGAIEEAQAITLVDRDVKAPELTFPFTPVLTLNEKTPQLFAVAGKRLYVGHDDLETSTNDKNQIIEKTIAVDVRSDQLAYGLAFVSLAYGAQNANTALLAAVANSNSKILAGDGALYFSSTGLTIDASVIYSSNANGKDLGIQSALFDRNLGVKSIYFTDSASVYRLNALDDPRYTAIDISGNLNTTFATFNEKRALAHVANNGVSALVVAGVHRPSTATQATVDNYLYSLSDPASALTATALWKTPLGTLPNAQVFGLDYSVADDVLLANLLGRGAHVLYDVTTYFPEATQLVFGQAMNDSVPTARQLTNGTDLNGATLNRPLIKKGTGTLDLRGLIAQYAGGTTLQNGATLVNADVNLGKSKTRVELANAALLKLDAGFAAAEPTTRVSGLSVFDRPLAIGLGWGTIDTGSNALAFTGGRIDSTASSLGTLRFGSGIPFTMGANLVLNAYWDADLLIPKGLRLQGSGGVSEGRTLRIGGTYDPGNSPGTVQFSGSLAFDADGSLRMEIDGLGQGDGAGNYDRIVMRSASGKFTAGGHLDVVLRDISSGNNNFSPRLGQGFRIVSAPGGLLDSFASLGQPAQGLLAGTRFDTVYDLNGLSLYATPASYANIAAAGLEGNSNRNQVGTLFEGIRPAAGVRESNAVRKTLFDSLAPLTESTLPVTMDQMGGVAYAQLVGMNFENSKFLIDQTLLAMAMRRRGEGAQPDAMLNQQALDEPQKEVWAQAIGRVSTWRGADMTQTMDDKLGGVLGGVTKQLTAQNFAGFSVAYAGSNPAIEQDMGQGPMHQLQLMAYASHTGAGGFFMQGAAGAGLGQISTTRKLALFNTSYTSTIHTANLALSGLVGWSRGVRDGVRYEGTLGMNYLGMRTSAFDDSGEQSAYALAVNGSSSTSFTQTLGAAVSVPLRASSTDWRVSAQAGFTHEAADDSIRLRSNLLGGAFEIQNSAIGRNRFNLGFGLRGQIDKQTTVAMDLNRQTASNWDSLVTTLSLKMAF